MCVCLCECGSEQEPNSLNVSASRQSWCASTPAKQLATRWWSASFAMAAAARYFASASSSITRRPPLRTATSISLCAAFACLLWHVLRFPSLGSVEKWQWFRTNGQPHTKQTARLKARQTHATHKHADTDTHRHRHTDTQKHRHTDTHTRNSHTHTHIRDESLPRKEEKKTR